MKYPKHRCTIYLVVRDDEVVIGSFRTADRASEFAVAAEQELKDRNIFNYSFTVSATTYYDE